MLSQKSDGKTKIHIQGVNVDSQLDFIFSELPKIYQKVCQKMKTKSIDSRECDACEFRSSNIGVLRKHIQDKHILTEKGNVQAIQESHQPGVYM